MVEADDYVLTNPTDWTWTYGMEHDPVEPSSVLLPGRVDAPANDWEGSSAVGHFDTQPAAAAAANTLSGICVAKTVILPNKPFPWGGQADRDTLEEVLNQLRAQGARDAFITDADTGYLNYFDIRAHCENRDQALAIGRQMAPILWPPWLKGLIKPWAPGRRLSEEQVRARMYVASLWRGSDRQPRDELESKIWEIWRALQETEERAAGQYAAGVAIDEEITSAVQKHNAALHALLGEEAEQWGLPWYIDWKVRVDNNDVCLSFVGCSHVAKGFPALVGWLKESGVRSAMYAVHNLIRP